MDPSTPAAADDDVISIIVDIANVMGARADGWWKDRAGAAARLCREIATVAARGLPPGGIDVYPAGKTYWVLVLEGAARRAAELDDLSDARPAVRLVLAPGSGDDTIAARARDLQGQRLVVTADRELRRRCEQAGATVMGPRWLLNML